MHLCYPLRAVCAQQPCGRCLAVSAVYIGRLRNVMTGITQAAHLEAALPGRVSGAVILVYLYTSS